MACYHVRMSEERTREQRRAARAAWPVKAYRLGEEPADDVADSTTARQRLAMVWRLTRDAWASSGRLIPDYRRDAAPGRVIRPGDA